MGANYVPLLLDEETKRWLRLEGVSFPDDAAGSRWPTPNELRAALESLGGYSVSYRDDGDGGWDAEIVDAERGYDGWSATIWPKDIANPDAPHEFSFHKPKLELAVLILEKLSHVCGPFVIVDDASITPVVVTPGSDVTVLAARYG